MGPTGVNSVPYNADFWAKIRAMRASGVSEADIMRYLQANTIADYDRQTYVTGQAQPQYRGPNPGALTAQPAPYADPNANTARYGPSGQPGGAPQTYNFLGRPYNFLGLSHLNLNPEVGYQAYADYTTAQQPGGQDSPFGSFVRSQFGQERNRYQVQAAQDPSLKWTDYLEKSTSDPMTRFRNLSPQLRGEGPVGRNVYGY